MGPAAKGRTESRKMVQHIITPYLVYSTHSMVVNG